jgi:hypothetical protein
VQIRPFGLTVNDRGIHVRIPDIEAFDRKKSMVFLTDNPTQILDFIGLDPQIWFQKFASQDEMFEYASGCRLFWVKPDKPEDEAEGDVILGGIEGQEGGEEGKKKYVSSESIILCYPVSESSVFKISTDRKAQVETQR